MYSLLFKKIYEMLNMIENTVISINYSYFNKLSLVSTKQYVKDKITLLKT